MPCTCRGLLAIETRESHGGIVVHLAPLLGCGAAGIWGRSVLVEEYILHVLAKNAGDLESERKTRIIAACFDGVDAGARHSDVRREFCLRPLIFRSKYS